MSAELKRTQGGMQDLADELHKLKAENRELSERQVSSITITLPVSLRFVFFIIVLLFCYFVSLFLMYLATT